MRKAIMIIPIIAVAFVACMRHSACEDKTMSRATSADGKYVATAYHRVCGASSGLERYYTWAELKEAPAHFWSAPKDRRILADMHGTRALTLRWDGPRRLVIVTSNLKDIDPERKGIGADTFWQDVVLHYE